MSDSLDEAGSLRLSSKSHLSQPEKTLPDEKQNSSYSLPPYKEVWSSAHWSEVLLPSTTTVFSLSRVTLELDFLEFCNYLKVSKRHSSV